jgi:transposase
MVGVRMSKRGNAYTRKRLYQCAFWAKRHCKQLEQIYMRARQRGKHYFVAMNILMKKLIHIMRVLINEKTVFDPTLI